jgi:hypothetical protein
VARGRTNGGDGFGGIARALGETLVLTGSSALLEEMSDSFARDGEAGLADIGAERARLAQVAAEHRSQAEACGARAMETTFLLDAQLGQMHHRITAFNSIRMLCRIEGATLRESAGSLDQIVTQLDAVQDEMGSHLMRTTQLGRTIQHAAA